MNTRHRFPIQDKPGLDLVMVELEHEFGAYSLEVHDLIVKIMDSEGVVLEDKKVRKMLSTMAIQLHKKLIKRI